MQIAICNLQRTDKNKSSVTAWETQCNSVVKINLMKILLQTSLLVFAICLSACVGKGSSKKEQTVVSDSSSVSDTGYTGIKQYMSGKTLVKLVTFKNGVREGLMRSFYQTGELRQTWIYKNGVREDSSIWFYQQGQPFRSTPYKNDTIDGIQRQYYRTGSLKAKIGYSKGLRTTFLQEFTLNGNLVKGYPDLDIKVADEYKTKSLYRLSLGLTNKSINVRYYRGDIANGVFDTAHCKPIKSIRGIGTLELKKTGSSKSSTVGVIAAVLTDFGNNYLLYKKIDLPYPDLN
jgi:antitoxin component YwqK of YwqJK toxin-antitoxin module